MTIRLGMKTALSARVLVALTTLLLCGLFALQLPAFSKEKRKVEFDHNSTGFPLSGAHVQARCESCHVEGVFKGTPRECALCHLPGNRSGADAKSPVHLPTTEACDQCHRSTAIWAGARFSHIRALSGSCTTCHNNVISTGKPATHIPTTATCDSCHRTTTWSGAAGFTHTNVAAGSCAGCHNGTTATGKSANHLQTTASCDSCHRTTAWIPATNLGTTLPPTHRPVPAGTSCAACHVGTSTAFTHPTTTTGCATCHNGATAIGKPGSVFHTLVNNSGTCETCHKSTSAFTVVTFSHSGVTPGQCSTCHNGANPPAAGKSPTHILTTASCDSCHSTTAWIPATFSHAGVAPGSCATCHNGTSATGKSAGHFVTTASCDACHSTTAWTPTTAYQHTSPWYQRHNAAVVCQACHTTNNATINWTFGTYKPDCAGCHAGQYKSGPHKKLDSPTTLLYTVAELKNCTGSCHIYTDSTFTTIKKSRTGQHRPTDGGF